eukprot:CAMPEP_0113488334 /NCGR_PEP_ID=MMETSP0014_2-20120614/25965_1 /TAXON_ID=2857 /ORGANISM="Nitzschia sp." /LENGTH=255 /DNA_ID=CAMNT_0000382047 /DNA_START=263 /DNA_END=1030 /DNA_ORIENTATION=- /assembly_acc=CAM_ASM_000159
MNMDELDDAQKKQIAGKCCYNILTLLSTAAFICGMWGYSACNFNLRYVTLAQNQAVEDACANANIQPPFDTLCEKTTGTHGVGFEGWWVQTDQVCYSYLQLAPNGLYVEPPLDTMFNSARALAITGLVFGGAAWFTLMMASCCMLDASKMRGVACYFFLACLFQGLSLLMFRSNICSDPGFFSVYLTGDAANQPAENIVESVSCGLSVGSKLAISATVLYFVCNSIVPMCIPPGPLYVTEAEQQRTAVPQSEPQS